MNALHIDDRTDGIQMLLPLDRRFRDRHGRRAWGCGLRVDIRRRHAGRARL